MWITNGDSQVEESCSSTVRWEMLFDDLLAQLDREQAAELADERRDNARAEVAGVSQREILSVLASGHVGAVIIDTLARPLTVRVDSVGADWVSVTEIDTDKRTSHGTHVIPTRAITRIALASGASVSSVIRGIHARELRPRLIDRIPFDVLLRDLARRRRWVDICTPGGAVAGTIDAVGRDWCEVARHPREVARRQSIIDGSVVLALSTIHGVCVD